MADEGELIVLAPSVETFGEDSEIDRLIRKYGYRGTPAACAAMACFNGYRRFNLHRVESKFFQPLENNGQVLKCLR